MVSCWLLNAKYLFYEGVFCWCRYAFRMWLEDIFIRVWGRSVRFFDRADTIYGYEDATMEFESCEFLWWRVGRWVVVTLLGQILFVYKIIASKLNVVNSIHLVNKLFYSSSNYLIKMIQFILFSFTVSI